MAGPVPGKLAISLGDVEAAAARIAGEANLTPVLTSRTMDKLSGRELFFKCELFQRMGAFKFRGALNAIRQLDPSIKTVITHSSGNHAQAIALAASIEGLTAHVVMPSNSPACKVAAVKDYGATITMCDPTKRVEVAAQVEKETAAACQIGSYNHPHVMAGQGTVGLELMQQVSDLDAIIVPVGGGGLISGIATAAKGLNPRIKIIGAEPANADDAARSKDARERVLNDGVPDTVADGLRTSLGTLTWPVVEALVDEIVTVSEEEIVSAMRLVWERMKLVIEPSAGVGVAVALGARFAQMEGGGLGRVGVVLCGGNQDLDKIPWLAPKAES